MTRPRIFFEGFDDFGDVVGSSNDGRFVIDDGLDQRSIIGSGNDTQWQKFQILGTYYKKLIFYESEDCLYCEDVYVRVVIR